MPRVADEDLIDPTFPWGDWGKELLKSPTKGLIFGPDDFGAMTPRRFRDAARKNLRHLGVRASVRGEEVLVVLNA